MNLLPSILPLPARPDRVRRPALFGLATLAYLGAVTPAVGGVLAGWDMHALAGGANAFGVSPLAASVTDPNVTVGGLSRGSGVGTTGTAAARAWGGTNWVGATAAASNNANQNVTFTLVANAGFTVSVTSISRFDYRRSSTGATSGVLQYQVGNGAFIDIVGVSYPSTASGGASVAGIDLSTIPALQNVPAGTTLTFRIVNYGASGTGGTWYLFDTANSTAADFEVSGSVAVAGGGINGVCGSADGTSVSAAPTANLCTSGTPSAVGGNGPWTWTCSGSGGGSSASCSANRAAGGSC